MPRKKKPTAAAAAPSTPPPLPAQVSAPRKGRPVANVDESLDKAETSTLRLLERIALQEGLDGNDARWMAIAKTHIEQGFMAARRATGTPAKVYNA